MQTNISNQTRLVEIFLVFLTAAGRFISVLWLNQRIIYVLIAITFWISYIIYKYQKQRELFPYWGFRKDNFKKSFLMILPIALVVIAGFVLVGWWRNTLIINWHLIPILLLYPAWGVVQQFLLMALVAGNMKDMDGNKLPDYLIVFLTAVLFALVHYPSYLLMGGTFVLAIVYTILYFREKNLWALGIYHGWLGGCFYFFVLGNDPWKVSFDGGLTAFHYI